MDAREVPHRSVQVGPAPVPLEQWRLAVDGLVQHPLALSRAELAAHPVELLGDSSVRCPDGFGISGGTYAGVRMETVLTSVAPLPEATWVAIHAGEYCVTFEIESLPRRNVFRALTRDGQDLTYETGGPVRLVMAKGACFDSAKWVDRISLERDGSSATALSIVKKRRAERGAAS